MPVQSMLSEFSVGNSTLRPVMDAADAEPAESTSKPAESRSQEAKVESARPSRAHCALRAARDVTRALAAHAVSQHPPLARRDRRADDMAAKLEALAELAAEVARREPASALSRRRLARKRGARVRRPRAARAQSIRAAAL